MDEDYKSRCNRGTTWTKITNLVAIVALHGRRLQISLQSGHHIDEGTIAIISNGAEKKTHINAAIHSTGNVYSFFKLWVYLPHLHKVRIIMMFICFLTTSKLKI